MKPRVARHSERAGDLRRVFLSASCARAVGHSAPSESLPLSFADRARGASRSALIVIRGGRFLSVPPDGARCVRGPACLSIMSGASESQGPRIFREECWEPGLPRPAIIKKVAGGTGLRLMSRRPVLAWLSGSPRECRLAAQLQCGGTP